MEKMEKMEKTVRKSTVLFIFCSFFVHFSQKRVKIGQNRPKFPTLDFNPIFTAIFDL